ncbi:MAG: 4a-hydroxytetrahydrobiopterin dehydratase [Acidimicrobiia bacterium]|nr:4a-hydroxytetrahydrobiopterin dehydratase [Acidimicrobiia bacterium]NNC41985.1 hypothetical protein [Acidimicrobiia bacterium]NNL49061.1 hypothetical protein [Acidimicrobiia bacterium]
MVMGLAEEPVVIRHTGDPLMPADAVELAKDLDEEWSASDGRLTRIYTFSNFAEALAFVNSVGELAEEVDHHPMISFTWGRVEIEIWTHSIGGLQRGDFVFAARVDKIYEHM